MLISRSAILKLIPDFVKISDNNFITAANAIGLEVELIIKHPKTNNLITGEILSITKHEKANFLNVCNVDIGSKKLQIVCGANNLFVGAKVIVALNGAKLFNGMLIQDREIRGIKSEGMLCAYQELTSFIEFLSDEDKNGIVILNNNSNIGSLDYIDQLLLNDTIYELSLPANRHDFNSHIILCLELAAKLNLKLNFSFGDINKFISKEYNKNNLYQSLNFLYINNIKTINLSEWHEKSFLMNNGIKPINNLLDYCSRITLLYAVPLHVYDQNKVFGNISCYLNSEVNKKFITLQKTEVKVPIDTLVLKDEKKDICLASIIGGFNCCVDQNTKNIIIEIANFNYLNIRNASNKLNILSDAAKKSSKPLSTFLTMAALEKIKNDFETKNDIIYNSKNWNTNEIIINKKDIKNFFGKNFSSKWIYQKLQKYGFDINGTNIKAPCWRMDVFNPQDIFEELLKEIDINKLKCIPVVTPVEFDSKNNLFLLNKLKLMLTSNYYNEANTYNLCSTDVFESFNIFGIKDKLLISTSNVNRSCLRSNLIYNILKIYQKNNSFKIPLIPLFEIQKIYKKDEINLNLTCILPSNFSLNNLKKNSDINNLSNIKPLIYEIENILNAKLIIEKAQNNIYAYNDESFLIRYGNEVIGYIFSIKKSNLKDFDLENFEFYCLTLNIEKLISDFKEKQLKIIEPSNFQLLTRDFNIQIINQSSEDINMKIDNILHQNYIQNCFVIDFFKDKEKTIYTLRLEFINDKIYSNKEIEEILLKVKQLVG